MTKERWDNIDWARKLLKLPQQVSRTDIQEAFRKRCREFHPDSNRETDTSEEMSNLNRAYRVLMEYADHYVMSLTENERGMSDEEWWMRKFGQDPIWAGDREEK